MNTHIFHPLRRRLGATAAAALTLLASACSGSLADDPDLIPGAPADPAATTDSIMRFPTIADLESLTPADLPGDFAGYELTDLSYECVDTIELRALRLNVTAGLSSPAGKKRTLTFTADVGPELVSVEYYPVGEFIPAHDNMASAFYPCVERYRNYSDGSRIGPDLFYDLGHFFRCYLFISHGDGGFGFMNYRKVVGVLDSEYDYYKDGIQYYYLKSECNINLNTTVITENGRKYSGEDLLPIKIKRPSWSPFRLSLDELLYDFSKSFPSRLAYDPDGILSMCSDVPDASPNPFPTDTESRAVGFYFNESVEDRDNIYDFDTTAIYNIISDDESDYQIQMPFCSLRIGASTELHTQYMVIDGRIIHYRDMFKDYIYPSDIVVVPRITKVSDGYLIHCEFEQYFYNLHIRVISEIHIKTYYGSPRVIDLSGGSWNVPASVQPEVTATGSGTESDGCYSRPDGTYMKVDRRLPSSLESVKQSRTINRSAL
ncbi:MAG: hypothetical protein K2I64_00945 [Muribaculaceae bacterium]|nr:hypothetical protein [Muribaculaceae bacterium]